MTLEEARIAVVEALNDTAHLFDNSELVGRLRSPEGDVALSELGLDSLDVVEWTVEIDRRTGVSLDPGEVSGVTMLSQVTALVASRAGENG